MLRFPPAGGHAGRTKARSSEEIVNNFLELPHRGLMVAGNADEHAGHYDDGPRSGVLPKARRGLGRRCNGDRRPDGAPRSPLGLLAPRCLSGAVLQMSSVDESYAVAGMS